MCSAIALRAEDVLGEVAEDAGFFDGDAVGGQGVKDGDERVVDVGGEEKSPEAAASSAAKVVWAEGRRAVLGVWMRQNCELPGERGSRQRRPLGKKWVQRATPGEGEAVLGEIAFEREERKLRFMVDLE